jgi:hypothetical protein
VAVLTGLLTGLRALALHLSGPDGYVCKTALQQLTALQCLQEMRFEVDAIRWRPPLYAGSWSYTDEPDPDNNIRKVFCIDPKVRAATARLSAATSSAESAACFRHEPG